VKGSPKERTVTCYYELYIVAKLGHEAARQTSMTYAMALYDGEFDCDCEAYAIIPPDL
jgi:hypothetical protein